MVPGQTGHMNSKGSAQQSKYLSSHHPGLLKPTLLNPLGLNYMLNSSLSHGRTLVGGSIISIPHHEPLPDPLFPHLLNATLDLLEFLVCD